MKRPIILTLIIAALTITSSCQREQKQQQKEVQQPEAVLVKVEKATRNEVHDIQEFTALTEARTTNRIAPQTGGRIKSILVEVGQKVQRGQLLATMDNAAFEQSRLQLEEQKVRFERIDELHKIGGISDADWESQKRAIDIAEQSINNIRTNTMLRSPITGVVTARNYDVGDLCSLQLPIFEVQELSRIKIKIDLSEQYYSQITKGRPVTLKVDALKGETFNGTITLIHPTIKPTHTFTVEIEVSNSDNRLTAGMYGRVFIDFGTYQSILVSDQAIIKQVGSSDQYLYKVVNNQAVKTLITTNGQKGDQIIISSGIDKNDLIITEGSTLVKDGSTIKIVE